MTNTLDSYGDKVFYGFRLDSSTGNLTLDILDGDTAVSLPQDNIIDPDDYKHWIWSTDTLELTWGMKGHLHMRIL